MKYIVGIDEAGRGPLAGPVSVGIVAMNEKDLLKWGRIKDSKQLREEKREEVFKKLKNNKFIVCYGSVKEIDSLGITRAIALAIERGLKNLKINVNSTILLDGSLKAPKEFKNQKTIIKGDEKETIIALASIVAKVSRDRLMKKLSKKYPKYELGIHKGYGTKKHISLIKKFGLSALHRRSFCKNYIS